MRPAGSPRAADDAARLVAVAVPVPILDLLTYRIPHGLQTPSVGARVLVPLGSRQMTGVVVPGETQPAGAGASRGGPAIRDLLDVIDDRPFLPETVVRLALWASDYYACGPGEAIAAAMPPLAWIKNERRVKITEQGLGRLGESPTLQGRRLSEKILHALREGRWTPLRRLAASLRSTGAPRNVRAPIRGLVQALEREGLVRTEDVLRGHASATRSIRVVALAADAPVLKDPASADRDRTVSGPLGPRQRDALRFLRGATAGIPIAALGHIGVSKATLKRLTARGLVTVRPVLVERGPLAAPESTGDGETEAPPGRRLTVEQTAALERLTGCARSARFRVALLHGVTGSGKTEIYVRLADVVRERQRRTLVLVPEIALTPALAKAFRGAFGARVAIQHSGLSDGERHDQWQRIRRGDVDVVVGTRSAVFAPLEAIGLIIVDEEHDTSYKQEESPRYHGRDLAIVRGKHEGALVVLGSATPSLETYANARNGRYDLIVLERRVLDRPLASVHLVNMRDELAEQGPEAVLSRALRAAIAERLERGEQSLVLLNRRGLATSMFCRQCGATFDCPNCSVSLIIHGGQAATARARCHYCNYSRSVPSTCLNCAGPYLFHAGYGTERVEAEIAAAFPGARVARLDRDTARSHHVSFGLLDRFARREIDVLVGTQMIAKGHDFPHVTLVGVVSADVGLGLADFRAGERTFQLLTQVVGRAGRGEQAGEAIIQTLFPEHYSIQHACRQDYSGFFADELRFRRAMRYPPAVGLISVVVRARTMGEAMRGAGELADRTRVELRRQRDFEVLGPAPAPLSRLRGESRAQFFLKGPRRLVLRRALADVLAAQPDLRRTTTIDVDPMSVL